MAAVESKNVNIQSDGLNRAKIWQIGLFVLNNTATNVSMVLIGYYSFFTQNVLGLAAVVVGLIATLMRVFDGITDPIVGYMIDKTNGKFGKFRPYIFIGQIVIAISMIMIFRTPSGWSVPAKYVYTSVWYAIYILGYTCQTAVTKGAQSALTNDPQQRPTFTLFDAIYNAALFSISAYIITTVMAPKYPAKLNDAALWNDVSLLFIAASIVMTALAIIGIWQKDRTEFFGTGTTQQLKLKDYVDVIKNNRPLQMLIVAASTDKLAMVATRGGLIYLFSNILLNSKLMGTYSLWQMVPSLVITFVGVAIATKHGIKRSFVIATWISTILIVALYILTPIIAPNGGVEAGVVTTPIIFLLVILAFQTAIGGVAGNIVIPMIADCTDYEVYRSGNFMPGIMGTLFSLVDKLISSFATFIVGAAIAWSGYGNTKIPPDAAVNPSFYWAILFIIFGLMLFGHIASIIAMKFYSLDGAMMEKVRKHLAEKRQEAQA